MPYLKVSKKKIHFSCEGRIENPSLRITVCHYLASLVMPNGDPRDGFFYPTLTLMTDSYMIYQPVKCNVMQLKWKNTKNIVAEYTLEGKMVKS